VAQAARVAPVGEGRAPVDGRPTAFVCERRACLLPAFDADSLMRQLVAPRGPRDPGGV
jgi:uncharacterized protein YyaL (SSP411 family)